VVFGNLKVFGLFVFKFEKKLDNLTQLKLFIDP